MIADILKKYMSKGSSQDDLNQWDILTEIDNKLIEIKIKWPLLYDSYVRVSSIPFLCFREEVLRSRLGVVKRERISAIQQRIFNIGTAFHSMMQNAYFSEYLWGNWKCQKCEKLYIKSFRPNACECGSNNFVYDELELISENLKITGHPDGILKKNGYSWLLELKSINEFGYDEVVRSNGPKRDHVIQMNFYMGFLKLQRGIIIYYNKDKSKWISFVVLYNPNLIKSIIDDLSYMRSAIKDKSKALPPKKKCEKLTCMRAKNCPVAKQCFSEDKNGF